MKTGVAPTTDWLNLRDAALDATRRGWPVTPGTYLGTDRRWHGRDNTQTLCPIQDTWWDTPVTDPAQAWDTWTHAPYGVLLVCGRAVAVLDLPITLIRRLTPTEPLLPIVVTARSRLLAITRADPETPLSPRLAQAGVRLSGTSGTPAWVALPTTTGVVLVPRWLTSQPKTRHDYPRQRGWWRHRHGTGQKTPRPRWSLPEMVDGNDVAHLVTSDAYETGLRERTGHYRMVCGRRITVGNMAARPNRYCRPCQVIVAWA